MADFVGAVPAWFSPSWPLNLGRRALLVNFLADRVTVELLDVTDRDTVVAWRERHDLIAGAGHPLPERAGGVRPSTGI